MRKSENEIRKALECCECGKMITKGCIKCPYSEPKSECGELTKDALELLDSKDEKIERLVDETMQLCAALKRKGE